MNIKFYTKGPDGDDEDVPLGDVVWDMCPRLGESVWFADHVWRVTGVSHLIRVYTVVVVLTQLFPVPDGAPWMEGL